MRRTLLVVAMVLGGCATVTPEQQQAAINAANAISHAGYQVQASSTAQLQAIQAQTPPPVQPAPPPPGYVCYPIENGRQVCYPR